MNITINIGPEGQINLYTPFALTEDLVVKILQHCLKLIEEKEKATQH